jgi:hypothetical protein
MRPYAVRKSLVAGVAGGALAAVSLALWLGAARSAGAADARMPEFSRQTADAWLNSPPLKAADLRGKVVLLEIYTSG